MDSRSFYLKKEVRNTISEIEAILDIYNNEEVELIQKRIKKNRDDLKLKGDLENIKTYADRIFELCPDCNCVPICVEYVERNYYSCEVELDSILRELGEGYSFEDDTYIVPHTTEEMTFGDWEKILKIWKIMLKYTEYKTETTRGEYNEYKFHNLYVYFKDTNSIEKIEGLNKERDYNE